MALAIQSEQVTIPSGKIEMGGTLWLPEDHRGVILFTSGSGTSRVKPPNDYVGCVLRGSRLATLWLDLVAPANVQCQNGSGEAGLLTQRLNIACDWLASHPSTRGLPIGLFGASYGAAAALNVAAVRGREIAAVVSRGGRPDLASYASLGKVSAPTLLIVGGLDERSLKLNRAVYAALRCRKRFEIIPGATHTFEETGSQEVVARLARGWFLQYAQDV